MSTCGPSQTLRRDAFDRNAAAANPRNRPDLNRGDRAVHVTPGSSTASGSGTPAIVRTSFGSCDSARFFAFTIPPQVTLRLNASRDLTPA